MADELWLQSVKAYTIDVFLSDLVSPLLIKDLTLFSLRSLETLRDMRLVNFEEAKLLDTLTLENEIVNYLPYVENDLALSLQKSSRALSDHNLLKKA